MEPESARGVGAEKVRGAGEVDVRRKATPLHVTRTNVVCCTSDITLEKLKTLRGKMDAANPNATTLPEREP